MNYTINILPDSNMLYKNTIYWNPGYEVLDTFIEFVHSKTRAKVVYHPKVPAGVLWAGHYQRLYANLIPGQRVQIKVTNEPVPVLSTVHFGYRQFMKNEGEDTPIGSQALLEYLKEYFQLNDTYVEEKQGVLIHVPFLEEKRVVLIVKSLGGISKGNGGIIRLDKTTITLEDYSRNPEPSAPLDDNSCDDPC